MISIFEAIILGIVQGVTEWLPISSSGHLILVQQILGINQPVSYSVFLHLASLIVLILVFKKEIISLIKGVLMRDEKSVSLFYKLIVGSIPIGFVGFFLNSFVKSFFTINSVGYAFIATGLILQSTKNIKVKALLTYKNSFIIGLSQAFSILPGISRSGVTISSALNLGVEKKEAVNFAFLLFIPAIIGASLVEFNNLGSVNSFNLNISMIVTIITGFFSLKFLLKVIKSDYFHYFSYYCLILGLITIVLI